MPDEKGMYSAPPVSPPESQLTQRILAEMVRLQAMMTNGVMALRDVVLGQTSDALRNGHSNPLSRFGAKCFSQTDEDGITLEILRRMKAERGYYAEFGVGNGLENNTLILAACGWKGFWVGGETLAFSLTKSPKFHYQKEWITRENVTGLADTGLSHFNIDRGALDVISLDLDGNDIYFVEELLSSGFSPKLFIVEYNAKFLPPVRFKIPYDPKHQWQRDDFFGASLMSFVDLFDRFGFRLVCCNAHTGGNAFFVRHEFAALFPEVPQDVRDIYVPPRYVLFHAHGHRSSPTVVQQILHGDE